MENLSPREFAVARLLLRGFSEDSIAAQLHISPGTVSNHRHSIFSKLGITSRMNIGVGIPIYLTREVETAQLDRFKDLLVKPDWTPKDLWWARGMASLLIAEVESYANDLRMPVGAFLPPVTHLSGTGNWYEEE